MPSKLTYLPWHCGLSELTHLALHTVVATSPALHAVGARLPGAAHRGGYLYRRYTPSWLTYLSVVTYLAIHTSGSTRYADTFDNAPRGADMLGTAHHGVGFPGIAHRRN